MGAVSQVSSVGTLRLFLDSAFQHGLVTRTQLRELQAFVDECHLRRPAVLAGHGAPGNPLLNASFSAVRSSPGEWPDGQGGTGVSHVHWRVCVGKRRPCCAVRTVEWAYEPTKSFTRLAQFKAAWSF